MRGVISDIAHQAAARFGDKIAMIFPDVGTLSFAEADALAGRFAGGLSAIGIDRGDRVILHLPNCLEWVIAYHALARLGAIVIPANILLSPDEISYIAKDTNALAAILPVERADIDVRGAHRIVPGVAEGTSNFEDLLNGPYTLPVEVDANDLFTIGYTSGTTGKPKGAMLTHGNVFTSVVMTTTLHVRTRHDRIYSALPFPHVYGNVVLNAVFLAGSTMIAPTRFDPGGALNAIQSERITLFEGVPTMYYQMLAHADLAAAELSSLTRCTVGGQTMPVAKLDAAATRFGCPILELWGMTEVAGPATSHSPWWPARHGSIGLPFPGTHVRIADSEKPDRDADPDAIGELMVRGPLVTSGYWNNPGATAEAFDAAGWFATGDIGRIDEDGYVFIVDRKKDMILTAGYNIYPAELEQVVAMHPAVAMVAVAGRPDEEKGEIAEAYVVLHRDAAADQSLLIAHCRKHLAAYKIPRTFYFVEDLPRTSTGKIVRRALLPNVPTA